jgi:hypothetical protein
MSMSILDGEELLTFAQAATLLPRRRGGSKVATSTLWRWSRRGSRGVVLRTIRVGGNVYVSREALTDFIAARSAVDHAPQQPMPTTASNRAMRELNKMGL